MLQQYYLLGNWTLIVSRLWQLFDKMTQFILIDWCLAPLLAIFQLYRDMNKLYVNLDI
jgi:hypothetical protein